jgi:hypothetical protein
MRAPVRQAGHGKKGFDSRHAHFAHATADIGFDQLDQMRPPEIQTTALHALLTFHSRRGNKLRFAAR